MAEHLLIYCRSGFESDAASEISVRAAELGYYGYPKFERNSGYILFLVQAPQSALNLITDLPFRSLVFARQWIACSEPLTELSTDDRVTPILESVEALPRAAELRVEVADTTEGRNLSSFAGKLGNACVSQLRKRELLEPRSTRLNWRLHLFVLSNRDFLVGVSPINNSSRWVQGIKRLKFPADAPSRSTLKLEEAWHLFIARRDWEEKLSGGLRAVDLGAAPGGWTYQLVKRDMFVTAVDNGPMDDALMESGQVEHLRVDAFTYSPAKTVDLMVCDIVDKPARVIDLVLTWATQRWARLMIFNLKLPMKRRFDEVELRLSQLESALEEAGVRYKLRAKQLYHDREEITCYLEL